MDDRVGGRLGDGKAEIVKLLLGHSALGARHSLDFAADRAHAVKPVGKTSPVVQVSSSMLRARPGALGTRGAHVPVLASGAASRKNSSQAIPGLVWLALMNATTARWVSRSIAAVNSSSVSV